MACSSSDVVEVEPTDEPEPVTQGPATSPVRVVAPTRVNRGRSRRMRPGRRALADQDVQLEVLHGRIEDLLDRSVEPVDLVDEQHVALLQIGQEGGEITGADQDGPGGDPQADPHLGGHDPGQRGLAQTGRSGEQQVVDRLAPLRGRLEDDLEVLGQLALADELGQRAGSQAGVLGLLGRCRPADRRDARPSGAGPGVTTPSGRRRRRPRASSANSSRRRRRLIGSRASSRRAVADHLLDRASSSTSVHHAADLVGPVAELDQRRPHLAPGDGVPRRPLGRPRRASGGRDGP